MRALALLFAAALFVSCSGTSPLPDGGGGGSGGGSGGSGGGLGGGGGAGGGGSGGSGGGGSGGSGGGLGGASGGSGGAGGSGGGGGAACSPACGAGRECCSGRCVNTANDPANCGACGVTCSGSTPHCAGSCAANPCFIDGGACSGGAFCCGSGCCATGQVCCDPQGPISGAPVCFTPDAGQATCPQGCAPLCGSDRNIKSDVRPIDEQRVLEQLSTLQLSTWRYTADSATVRHLGPMAQDFRATFGLGASDTTYHAIDAHGVSLAAIKALYQRVQDQERRLERLETENARLRSERACRVPER